MDDIHIASCVTPGCMAIPVALGLGSAAGAADSTILRAIVAGYEAAIRLGQAVDGPNLLLKGFWPTNYVAQISAAATVATILELEDDPFVQVLSDVGPPRWDCSWPKLTPSVRGQLLASNVICGMTAVLRLAGKQTPPECHQVARMPNYLEPEADSEILLAPAPHGALLRQAEIKPFSIARQALTSIDALQQLLGRVSASDINRVSIRLPRHQAAMLDRPVVASDATFASLQFLAALIIIYPAALYRVDRASLIDDPAIQRMMKRITVAPSDFLTGLYPAEWGAEVEVTTVGGQRHALTAMKPSGPPDLSWSSLIEKYSTAGVLNFESAAVASEVHAVGASQAASSMDRVLAQAGLSGVMK